MTIIMLCIEMCQRVCGKQNKFGWAVPPNALRRNGPECAAAFDDSQTINSGVIEGLIRTENIGV